VRRPSLASCRSIGPPGPASTPSPSTISSATNRASVRSSTSAGPSTPAPSTSPPPRTRYFSATMEPAPTITRISTSRFCACCSRP
jgi:hypothetical protein